MAPRFSFSETEERVARPKDKIRELREKKKKLAHEMRALVPDEGKSWTGDAETNFENLDAEVRALDKQIDREERLLEIEGEIEGRGLSVGDEDLDEVAGEGESEGDQRGSASPEQVAERRRAARHAWLLGGTAGVPVKLRRFLGGAAFGRQELRSAVTNLLGGDDGVELREATFNSLNEFAGGLFIPAADYEPIAKASRQASALSLMPVTYRKTSTRVDIPMPTMSDLANKGRRVGRGDGRKANKKGAKPAIGRNTLPAFAYTSDEISISWVDLEDSEQDLEALILEMGLERIQEVYGEEMVLNSEAGGPQGLANVVKVGHTSAASNAIAWDDQVEFEHSLRADLRVGSEMLVSDGYLKQMKRMTDGDGRLLWQPNAVVGQPDTINNEKYRVEKHLTFAPGQIAAIKGNWRSVVLRDAAGVIIVRLTDSEFAREMSTGFMVFAWKGGAYNNPGHDPLVALKIHS